jgi:MscS family membrane protein
MPIGCGSISSIVVGLLFLSRLAWAQPALDANAVLVGGDPPAVAPGSPQAAVRQFLESYRAGSYFDAARHLDLSVGSRSEGAGLARRLGAVLERHVGFRIDAISALRGGNLDDGLAADVEEVGQAPGPGGNAEPLRLRRAAHLGRWLFDHDTVQRIDFWYRGVAPHWWLDHVPAALLRPGPRGVFWWQWLGLPVLVLAGWALGFVLSSFTRRLLGRGASRTKTAWDEALLGQLGAPLTVAWSAAAVYLLLPWVGLNDPAEQLVLRCLRAASFAAFFWALLRGIDVARQMTADLGWAKERPAARSLLPLVSSVGKLFVLAAALVALLSEFGYPVASLVAGLGLGGLALALGAQKTLENLFGAFSIGADQPFGVGDFVRIEELLGTVEAIGLRSTRIRTLDRTLVSIPNGKLADMRLETFAVRDRLRLACIVGLAYGTRVAQIRAVLAGLESVLRQHPKIWPDTLIVRLKEFGESSLNLEVMAWFQTSDWNEFLAIREETLLQFLEVVEREGSSFAFPTRTIHLVTDRSQHECGH